MKESVARTISMRRAVRGKERGTWPGTHGVDADTSAYHHVGETSRKRDDGALGRCVIQEVGTTDVCIN